MHNVKCQRNEHRTHTWHVFAVLRCEASISRGDGHKHRCNQWVQHHQWTIVGYGLDDMRSKQRDSLCCMQHMHVKKAGDGRDLMMGLWHYVQYFWFAMHAWWITTTTHEHILRFARHHAPWWHHEYNMHYWCIWPFLNVTCIRASLFDISGGFIIFSLTALCIERPAHDMCFHLKAYKRV